MASPIQIRTSHWTRMSKYILVVNVLAIDHIYLAYLSLILAIHIHEPNLRSHSPIITS